MEGFNSKVATNYKTVSYADITEQIKKIQNLRAAIKEGEESGFHKDFDPDAFLQKIKAHILNG